MAFPRGILIPLKGLWGQSDASVLHLEAGGSKHHLDCLKSDFMLCDFGKKTRLSFQPLWKLGK